MTEVKKSIGVNISEETNNPLVSVFLICFNHANFIRKCVNSIIDQTYSNIDLTIIDNNSTDNSRKIIKELSKNNLFNVVFQQNIGLVKTLNKIISTNLIKGKYVCFLSCDDYWHKNKIIKESFFDLYSKNRIDLNDMNFGSFQTLMKGNYIAANTVMFKKSALLSVGLYDEKLFVEDYPMMLKISKRYKFYFIKEQLAFYRSHENNIHKLKASKLQNEIYSVRLKEIFYCFKTGHIILYFRVLASFFRRKIENLLHD